MSWSSKNIDSKLWNNLCIENNIKAFESLDVYSDIYNNNNWINKKIAFYRDNKIISFSQIFIKKKFINLIYIPGGIEGILDDYILQSFIVFLKDEYNFNSVIFLKLHNSHNTSLNLKNFTKMISTYEINLTMNKNFNFDTDLLNSYSKNWRHNLKRSFKYNFVIKRNYNPNSDELISLYKQMELIKNKKFYFNNQQLTDYFNILSNNIIHYECRVNGVLISFRTTIFFNNNAWDFLACSNLIARKNYSTYRIVNQIFGDCIKLKIKNYNFSGVDIKNNLGVYNFKKGAGSKEYRKIGEIIWSPIFIYKYLFILLVLIKRLFIR